MLDLNLILTLKSTEYCRRIHVLTKESFKKIKIDF